MARQYTFGPFLLDERERRLTRKGGIVHLQPKSFEVLLYLLENAGKLVEKDEVLDAVWRDTIVTENSLTGCIRQIRVALADHADAPDYIETVPSAGYRFIADVRSSDTEPAEEAAQPAAKSRRLSKPASVRLAAAGALAVLLSLALLWFPDGKETGPSSPAAEPEMSTAVLPFVNMSDDPANEYFSDGLSEEILNLLARIPGLKVIGRTSSFAFKGKNEDLRVIGEQLGVKTVLEGSVRKSGDRVRVTAQLIDASDGSHIWSETYDRTITDIFAVQDDVAAAIIRALHIHVGAAPTRGNPTRNPEAYALFLRARVLLATHKPREALGALQQATALDPDFAEAHELLAFNFWSQSGFMVPMEEGFAHASEAAIQALAINPDLPFARAIHFLTTDGSRSRVKAIEELERAWLESPGDPAPLRLLIYELQYTGYLREAHRFARQFIAIDPLSPVANYNLGETLYSIGKTAEAIAQLTVAFHLDDEFAKWFLPGAHLVVGQDDIAISLTEQDLASKGFTQTAWVGELVAGARDPRDGQAYLDRRTEEILETAPDDLAYYLLSLLNWWHLYFGHLDRYYELTFAFGPNERYPTDADVYVWGGTVFRLLGFTAHSRYLEVAELLGLTDVWEQRGPPDFCEKVSAEWVCE